ncbi:MAG: TlpA family protein disulfide reductase [Bacteroidetes bacterium]|nr:TlpA family protein disulfide reductase [Bacteroidota bacterium]
MKIFFFLFSTFIFSLVPLFAQISPERTQMSEGHLKIQLGAWHGTLRLNDSVELPFSFSVDYSPEGYTLTIHNSEESIQVEDLVVTKDSVSWHMPVFDSYFKCRRETDSTFSGSFYNHAASHPYVIPFHAKYGNANFIYYPRKDPTDLSGKWECHFSPGTPDSSNAIGIFSTPYNSGYMTGTFLTETGDYRYLGGAFGGWNDFTISTFDGSHAFVFKGERQYDGTIKGEAWYGNYGYEKWIAKRNDNYQLRDPLHLTYVVDSSKINFTFNDLNGNPVSLSDPQFKGKVVIIQVMGTWCPNCMDETAMMTELYNKYHDDGLEIVALAYERSSDSAIANANIRRVKKRFGSDYTFLLTGKKGAKGASESLPFLNGIMSFPTTIYIDRNGNVREVYTGFNGPATGEAYETDKRKTELLINKLLAEKAK